MGATNWCQGHGVRPRYYTGAPYHVSRKSCGSTAVKRRRKVARKCTPAEERGCKLLKGNSSRDRDAALASEPVKRKKLRLARADLVSPPLPPDNSTRIALPSTNSFLRSSGAGLAGKSSSPPISRQAQHIVTASKTQEPSWRFRDAANADSGAILHRLRRGESFSLSHKEAF